MAKRKGVVDSDEDEVAETPSEWEEEKPKKKPTSKGKATAKKPRYDDDDSEEERPMKRQKVEKPNNKTEEPVPGGIKTNYEGDRYVDLGKKKRATVRSFKGSTFIDIREFYGQEGDEKPGKKGITLSPEQWETMKSQMDDIDWMMRKLKR